MLFERNTGRALGLLIVCLFLHLASALPREKLSAQTGPSNGVASVSPSTFAFGGVQVGESSAPETFSLSNTGTGPLGSIAIASSNPDYVISNNTCPTSLAVGAPACTFMVTFTPSFPYPVSDVTAEATPDSGSIVITDDAAVGTTIVVLTGTGVGPVYLLPFEIFFDGQAPGTTSEPQTATLSNTNDSSIAITAPTLTGHAASDFSVVNNQCGQNLNSDSNCTMGITFTPSTTVLGPRTADVTISSDTTGASYISHLTGNGAIQHLPGFLANSFPPNDDSSTDAVNLPFSVNFFGTTYNQLYVNNNGNVTFGQPLGTYTPFGLTTAIGIPIIAPFFADVYTITPGSDVVHYGVDTVNGQQSFGVNWENVAYYAEPEDCSGPILLNSFQLILIDRPDTGAGNFDMQFNYDKIQWETGSASGGDCGFGGSSAAAGYSNGTGDAGTNFQIAGSLVNGAFLDVPTASGYPGLINSDLNSTMLGRYVFQVRNGAVEPTLTVTEAGTGTGTVTSSPEGISCPSTCSAGFPTNTNVTLTATAGDGSSFAGFSSNCTPANPQTNPPTCTISLSAIATVTATFNTGSTFLLTVVEAGSGTGTVMSAPTGVSCPGTCSASFASGTQVTLTESAATNSTFAGWSGGGCTGTGTCVVTLNAATIVTATFNSNTNGFALTVAEAGTGTGTVTSAPAGISCPTTCSANFASGTQVTLTAAASANSTFAGWSGGGCTGTGTCVVTVTAATAVTATFNSASPVTIGIGQGSSTVTTTPGSSAVFGLVLTALPGTTGTVQLTCASPVLSITCSIVPSSITLTGKAINVAIVVETFCKGSLPNFVPMPRAFGTGLGLLLATLCLCGAAWTYKKQPRWAVSFGMLIIFAVGMSACSNVAKSPSGSATPPGNYPLTVTATAPNGGTSSVNLTLVVK